MLFLLTWPQLVRLSNKKKLFFNILSKFGLILGVVCYILFDCELQFMLFFLHSVTLFIDLTQIIPIQYLLKVFLWYF